MALDTLTRADLELARSYQGDLTPIDVDASGAVTIPTGTVVTWNNRVYRTRRPLSVRVDLAQTPNGLGNYVAKGSPDSGIALTVKVAGR